MEENLHNNLEKYLSPLQEGVSLEIFNDNKLIFSSSGKWLHPIFDFQAFLTNYDGKTDNLSAHDTAIGKAALFLLIKNGVKKIHGNLVSQIAIDYLQKVNENAKNPNEKISLTWDNSVEMLKCKTEQELKNMTDEKEMYRALCTRANIQFCE